MIQYWEEEMWELSEKILVQIVGSEKYSKYKTGELVKYCYAIALEFHTQKDLALQKARQENKYEDNHG